MRQTKKRFPVTIMLDRARFDALTAICEDYGISRADFLRSAIANHEHVPAVRTRPTTGICLERHKARIRREKRKAKGKG